MNNEKPLTDFWKELNTNGFYLHQKQHGLIYKYVSYETAIKIIEASTLQFSLPIHFNDPFDLSLDLLDTTLLETKLDDYINKYFSISDQNLNSIIKPILTSPGFISQTYLKVFEEERSKIGICCFSKSYIKTLMWSHYAEKHSGICLGFAFEEPWEKGAIQVGINYKTNIEPVNFFSNSTYSIYNWLFTKSHVWSYEEEVRRVYVDQCGLINFNKIELQEIYYGLNLKKEKVKHIQELFEKLNYSIKKQAIMKMNNNTFDLKEEIIFKSE